MSEKLPQPPRKRSLFADKPASALAEVSRVLKPIADKIIAADDTKPKGGRPPLHPDKPWIAEGISRKTWYKRRRVKP